MACDVFCFVCERCVRLIPCLFSIWSHKHGKFAKYNLNLLEFAFALILSLTFWRFWLLNDQSGLDLCFSVVPPLIVKCDSSPRWRPSGLELRCTQCIAAPLIAVMALRAPGQTNPNADVTSEPHWHHHPTSPPFLLLVSVHCNGEEKGEGENKVIGLPGPLLHDTSWT